MVLIAVPPKPAPLTPVLENTRSSLSLGSKKVTVQTPETKSQDFKSQKHPWGQLPHYMEPLPNVNRKALSEDYENPVTEREGWWRTYIRETPLPGAYESQHYLEEVLRRPNTYRFKSDGRKLDAHPHGKGALLMPGAYEHFDFLKRLEESPATYNFRAVDRSKNSFVGGSKDRDINVSPNAYGIEKYLSLTVDKVPSKHSMFKSQSKRFPTKPFKPREGPAPGNYEYQPSPPLHAVSSSFKSRTPRFSSSHTRVPGPGSYEKTFQYPMSETISNMGRQHGLFFTSAFQS